MNCLGHMSEERRAPFAYITAETAPDTLYSVFFAKDRLNHFALNTQSPFVLFNSFLHIFLHGDIEAGLYSSTVRNHKGSIALCETKNVKGCVVCQEDEAYGLIYASLIKAFHVGVMYKTNTETDSHKIIKRLLYVLTWPHNNFRLKQP